MYIHVILQVWSTHVDVFTLIALLPPEESVVVTFEVIENDELFPTSVAFETGMLHSHHEWIQNKSVDSLMCLMVHRFCRILHNSYHTYICQIILWTVLMCFLI